MENINANMSTFQRLKVICVPLLGNSVLNPTSIPGVLKLLVQLRDVLRTLDSSGEILSPSAISYVFFPISTILRRNDISTIPDQVLERTLEVLALLCDAWWWDIDVAVWEQIFMLCSAILGGIDRKGKRKDRDDETKAAAAECLWVLLRPRFSHDGTASTTSSTDRANAISALLRGHARGAKFLPILGQTLDSLLNASQSPNGSLQRVSLKVLSVIVSDYLPDGVVPSILPGTVSTMSKVALGINASKGWANGDIVAAALLVMQHAILRAIGDEICLREGAVKGIGNLEDLLDDSNPPLIDEVTPSPFMTRRTESWLSATASQLHIAMNALSPLAKHPTPSALLGLAEFSATVLSATSLTVPQSQPLLLSLLLSLQRSSFDRVSDRADSLLRQVLTAPYTAGHRFLQVLLQISRDNLAALPRLLMSHADSKVEHVAGILESICRLAQPRTGSPLPGVAAISTGVGKLLGPHGGVEKWGWSLLSTLEFISPPVVVTPASTAQLMLEDDPAAMHSVSFPELTFRHINSRSAREALERMFSALGTTAGEDCLFAVDWFVDVGLSGRVKRAVAALWCACRLLEGVGQTSSGSPASVRPPARQAKRLEKFARDLARRIGEAWDDMDMEESSPADERPTPDSNGDGDVLVEHVSGLINIRGISGAEPAASAGPAHRAVQSMLHRGISLQLLSVTSGILESRFLPLLLHTLYPVLHGIVSDALFVSTSALAALNAITISTSFATPANLLLSNFDYALDAVSRRLTRRWLDVDATKVLAVLVRLVGHDVVQKAGDVVEECFDRLDEYHGYEIVVDGLLEVLREVVKVIEEDDDNRPSRGSPNTGGQQVPLEDGQRLEAFAEWFAHRHDEDDEDTPEESMRDSSYPREAWGKTKEGADAEASEPAPGADDHFAEPPPTPAQALTQQIVSRSLYFLTHGAPQIRARILDLLANAVPVLPESGLLPSVHQAWPFILNRLDDAETFVVSAAAALIAALALHVGDFMHRRIWDDVWPRFRKLLLRLEQADASNALAHRAQGAVGTASAYTHSHRLYRAVIQTLTAAACGVQAQDEANWEVIVLFRRFLHRQAHEELQACARELYIALGRNNADAVWLGLAGTVGWVEGPVSFLHEPRWDVEANVRIIL
ncbi:armadillo-type protein [Trametes meyenii]|nr:armadillo-type protein [Trametes meyenii]